MTTTEKRLSIAATAMALLLAVLFAMGGIFGTSAHALAPEYNEDPYYYDIYYFTDYCQAIDPARLEEEFDGRRVFVDRQKDLDETKFANMVQNDYFFDSVLSNIVIIDIKTFKPDPYLLYDLFERLKADQNCMTVFVTSYEYDRLISEEDGTYYDPWFKDSVDIYIDDSNYDRLRTFIDNSFSDMNFANNTAYIIDGYLVDVGTERDLGDGNGVPDYGDDGEGSDYIKNNFGADMDTLCADSPFLRIFLEKLIDRIDRSYVYKDYEDIAFNLRQYYGVKLLVHMGGNKFVDILTWEVCEQSNPFDFTVESYDEQKCIDNVCVFGFWRLTQDLYDYFELRLLAGEQVPSIYILIVDYPNNDDGILPVITDSSLAKVYGREWDGAASEMLFELYPILN